MKIPNSKLKIESTDTEIKFIGFDDKYQRLTIGEFHGKYYLYMYGVDPKVFKVLDNTPKLTNKSNILILDIGDKFFNINIVCTTVDEMTARVEELKSVISKLYSKFTELNSKPKNKIKSHKKPLPKAEKIKEEFGNIFIPDALEELGIELHNEEIQNRYPKSVDEYINDIIEIYDAKDIAFINKQGKLKLNFAFIEAIEGIKHKR